MCNVFHFSAYCLFPWCVCSLYNLRINSYIHDFSLSLTPPSPLLITIFTFVSSSYVALTFSPPAKATTLFRKQTKAIVWGMQTRAVQGMLDFDYVCSRDEPSVTAMVYPFT